MNFLSRIIGTLFDGASVDKATENDERYELHLTANIYNPPSTTFFNAQLLDLSGRDSLTFSVVFGSADTVTFFSQTSSVDSFIDGLNNEYSHQQGELIKIYVLIDKSKVEDEISVYDLKLFTQTVSDIPIANCLAIFNRALSSGKVIFKVVGLEGAFNTQSIYFYPFDDIITDIATFNRADVIESLRSLSYFTGIEEYQLCPQDFKILHQHNNDDSLYNLFSRLSIVLSVIYLFDITSISENNIEFKINGYKAIKGSEDIKSMAVNDIEEYYEIFKWVYTGGNLSDKIGLARNIITLHFTEKGKLALAGHPMQSIQSSYKVYEKQNIKQYIEIRNKITDQLIEFSNRANKIIETFASGFQKSALAVITFYMSAIAIKVIGKGDLENIFSLDVTILSLAFIGGSFLYYLVSRWEVIAQRKRFVKTYDNLKTRYTDLLDSVDIVRILNNDVDFKDDLSFINRKLKAYTILWIGFLLILSTATIILFCTYNISQLLNAPLTRMLFNNPCNC